MQLRRSDKCQRLLGRFRVRSDIHRSKSPGLRLRGRSDSRSSPTIIFFKINKILSELVLISKPIYWRYKHMNLKQFIILIIILLAIVIGYFLLFSPRAVSHNDLDQNQNLINFNDDLEVIIRDMSQVPEEFYSGNSRFSRGSCQTDSDCQALGCFEEICTSESNIEGTCEFSANFPNQEEYGCGCIVDTCGWYQK